MQRANFVPPRGVGAEIGGGDFVPRRFDRVQSLAIASQSGVGGIERGYDVARQRRALAGVGQPEEHPRPLAKTRQQAGVAQQLQVSRHPRLALTEHLGELGFGQFALGAEGEQPQSRFFARRLQSTEKSEHRPTQFAVAWPSCVARMTWFVRSDDDIRNVLNNNIFMSLEESQSQRMAKLNRWYVREGIPSHSGAKICHTGRHACWYRAIRCDTENSLIIRGFTGRYGDLCPSGDLG